MNPAPGVCAQRALKDLFSSAARWPGLASGRGRLCGTCVLITCRALINGRSFCLAPRTLLKTRCFISVRFPGTLIPVNNRAQTLSTWSSSKSRGPLSSPRLPRAALVTAAPPGAAGCCAVGRRGSSSWTPGADQPRFPLFPAFFPSLQAKK